MAKDNSGHFLRGVAFSPPFLLKSQKPFKSSFSVEGLGHLLLFGLSFALFLGKLAAGHLLTHCISLPASGLQNWAAANTHLLLLIFAIPSRSSMSTIPGRRIRGEMLGALINGLFLLAFAYSYATDILKRFQTSQEDPLENPLMVMALGGGGALLDLARLGHLRYVRRKKEKEQMCQLTERDDVRLTRMTFSGGVEEPSSPDFRIPSTDYNRLGFLARKMSSPKVTDFELHPILGLASSLLVGGLGLLKNFADPEQFERLPHPDSFVALIVVALAVVSIWPSIVRSASGLVTTAESINFDVFYDNLNDLMDILCKLEEVERDLLDNVGEIISIKWLRIWEPIGELPFATARLRFSTWREYSRAVPKIERFFASQGIFSSSVQPEFSVPEFGESRDWGTGKALESVGSILPRIQPVPFSSLQKHMNVPPEEHKMSNRPIPKARTRVPKSLSTFRVQGPSNYSEPFGDETTYANEGISHSLA